MAQGTFIVRILQVTGGILAMAGVAAALTTLIILIAGAPPLETFQHLLKGALGSTGKAAHTVMSWIPLCLCACGLLYTFRIGLWNIGIEGQMMMGAVFAVMMLRWGTGSEYPGMFIISAFFWGALGGAFWAFLAGVLKTKGGVNEIFAGLGLNFVAQGFILWLIFGPWRRPGTASMSGTELLPRELWLSYWPGLRITPVGVYLALATVIITALMLRYTKIGLNLKAVGGNAFAAQLYGLRPGWNMLLAMLFAGGFAGLAGAFQVTGVYHRLIPAISSNYGYLALMVVMLANYNVWSAIAVAFLFAGLNVGSIQLPMMLKLDSALSGVIQGALVLTALGMQAWQEKRKQ